MTRRPFNRSFGHPPGPRARVDCDDERVTCTLRDGGVESVRWADLREVEILTTDDGPFTDDVIWVLVGGEGGCAVPSDTDGMRELLARLQRLPGFDNDQVIDAMRSTSNGKFVCWRRKA